MPTTRSAILPLIAAYLGLFVGLIDSNAVNLALPAIRADLGGGVSGVPWIADAYNVTFAALLLTAGSLGDRLGRRRLLRIGLLTFLAASLACALAPTLDLLLGARAVQGVGAGLMLPQGLAIAAAAFPGAAERASHGGLGDRGGVQRGDRPGARRRPDRHPGMAVHLLAQRPRGGGRPADVVPLPAGVARSAVRPGGPGRADAGDADVGRPDDRAGAGAQSPRRVDDRAGRHRRSRRRRFRLDPAPDTASDGAAAVLRRPPAGGRVGGDLRDDIRHLRDAADQQPRISTTAWRKRFGHRGPVRAAAAGVPGTHPNAVVRRTGPRLPMTVGLLLMGAGMLWYEVVGPDASLWLLEG